MTLYVIGSFSPALAAWDRVKENTIFVCVSGKITTFLGHFSRIKEDKRKETIWLHWPVFIKLANNSAAELFRCSTFYSTLFDLCDRTFGQLATLLNFQCL
jgi:hypothetical protein